ncbi:MAG: hypothetical protein D6707_11280 [Bacteroidetes bacterium]|nr:MAG: hypothetical protein D6707_11280 [Bacteroidota bacterium]
MEFVYPSFLYALSALIIPVIIHLFHFRRFKKHYFSNVSILKEVQVKTDAYRKIKHLLVLLMRLFFLFFLILAFAQPYIPETSAGSGFTQKVSAIYIDNSLSMKGKKGEIPLLEIAKNYAYKILETLDNDEKIQILTNNFEGKQQRLLTKEKAKQVIENISYSYHTRDYSAVFRRISDAMQSFNHAQKNIYVISDFQKINFTDTPLPPDSAFKWFLFPVQSDFNQNIAVDSLWFESPVRKLNQPEILHILLKNYGTENYSAVPLKIEVNGQSKNISSVSVKANASTDSTVKFTLTLPGWKLAKVYIEDYPFNFDDTLYFSWQVKEAHKVLIISPEKSAKYFIKLFETDSSVQYVLTDYHNIDYSQLPNFDAVILVDLKEVNSGLKQSVKYLLDNGKNLVIFPSRNLKPENINSFLSELSLPEFKTADTSKMQMGKINTEIDFFLDIFEDIPKNMNYPFVTQKWILKDNYQINELISLKNGMPAVFSKDVRNGKVFMHTFDIDESNSNYLHHALFVPVTYKTVTDLKNTQPLYIESGGNTAIALPYLGKDKVYKIAYKNSEIIPPQQFSENATLINFEGVNLTKGTFPILTENDSLVAYVSINHSSKESNISYATEDEISEFFNGSSKIFNQNLNTVSKEIIQEKEAYIYWKEMLLLALLFLLLEILIIRFMR